MSINYYLEYRLIPSMIEEVKRGGMPLASLTDTERMKEMLADIGITSDLKEFSAVVYDETFGKAPLQEGKYIAYTFPEVCFPSEAKYGVIDIGKMAYYTFESDLEEGVWAIGSQVAETHYLIEIIRHDMTLQEFMEDIGHPKKRFNEATKPGSARNCCLLVTFLIIAALLLIGLGISWVMRAVD